MSILEVNSKSDWRLFHQVPHLIYKDDPNWICPLESEVADIFDPQKNMAFQHGKARVYVALNSGGRPVGRIAAFIDEPYSDTQPYRLGGIGFFESIDDDEVAQQLFTAAEDFLRQEGVEVVEGPSHFGNRDRYWGLLVKGFDPPLFQENYQPRYYQRFFEQAGYQPFEQVLTLKGESRAIPAERMRKVVERVSRNHDVRVEKYDSKHRDRYARDFCTIYNAAFSKFPHFTPIKPAEIVQFLDSGRFVLDPYILCIVYFEGQPAGCCGLVPDINPLLKGFKGKLSIISLIRFLIRKMFRRSFNAKGLVFGIDPRYSSKGIFAFIMNFLTTPRNVTRYPNMYLTTIRAHNKEILSIYSKLNVHIDRVHLTYRKPLSDQVTIEPFEMINLATLD